MPNLLQYPNMILERHQQNIMHRNYTRKAERKVCSAHTISVNTTLPPSYTNQEENKDTIHAFRQYLPLMFHPETLQDDKILPKHIKINPKVSFHTYKIQIKLSREPNRP